MRSVRLQRQSRLLQQHRQQAFTKRNGSNVPGPLEARRRHARRKYGATASSVNGTTQGDVGAMLSFDPRVLNRERELYAKDQEVRKANTTTPRSTGRSVPASDPSIQNTNQRPLLPPWLIEALGGLKESELHQEEQNATPIVSLEQWKAMLQACGGLDDIKATAVQSAVSLLGPNFSRLAFERLIQLRPSHDRVVEFLSDRSLNPSGAHNLTVYTQSLLPFMMGENRQSKLARRDLRRLRKWMVQDIRLGSMAEEEIRNLLRWTTARSRHNANLGELLWKQVVSVYEGASASNVRPIQQLQPATIRALLRSIGRSSHICLQVRNQLAQAVIKAVCVDQHTLQTQLTTVFLRNLADARNTSHFAGTRILASTHLQTVVDIFKLNILHLPANEVAETVIRAVCRQETLETMKRQYNTQWLDVCLQRPDVTQLLKQAFLEKAFPSEDFKSLLSLASDHAVATFMQILPPSTALRLLVAHLQRLTQDLGNFDGPMPQPKVSNELKSFIQLDKTQRSSIFEISETLPEVLRDYVSSLPEPTVNTYANSLISVFSYLEDDQPLEFLTQFCQQSSTKPMLIRAVNRLARTQPGRALSIFLAAPQLRLEDCLPLSAAIIASPSISTEILFNMLERSLRYRDRRPERQHGVNHGIVGFLHRLGPMLAASEDPKSAVCIQKILATFSARPYLARPSLIEAYIRSWVCTYTRNGGVLFDEPRQRILDGVAHFRHCGDIGRVMAIIEKESVQDEEAPL